MADWTGISVRSVRRTLAELLEAIRRKRPPLIDAYEGRRSVEIITAIYESAKSGKPVRIKSRR